MKSKAIKWLNEQIGEDTTKAELDIIEFCKKAIRDWKVEEKNTEKEEYIVELFDKFYKVYCRKGGREQAKKTWRKKLVSLPTKEKILEKARKIAMLYSQYAKEYEGKDKQYVPMCSSWLNANVPDKGE
jgi:hypothetical protein